MRTEIRTEGALLQSWSHQLRVAPPAAATALGAPRAAPRSAAGAGAVASARVAVSIIRSRRSKTSMERLVNIVGRGWAGLAPLAGAVATCAAGGIGPERPGRGFISTP